MNIIKTETLTKRYGILTAVDSLDLTVENGEFFALLGVNGAGKTTTIRMLSGLTRPTSGDAILAGHSIVSDRAAVHRVIGVSPQETAIAPNLTVRVSDELSERLGLDEVMNRKAGRLSGGWQRRLSIAMALVSEPKILFLDEPTLGLDVIARSELWDVLRALKGRITVILTTHYMEEAEVLSDRVGIMRDGHLLTVGTPADICRTAGKERFEDAFVAIVKGEAAL